MCIRDSGRTVNDYQGGKKPKVIGLQFWAVVRTLLENCKNVKEALDTLYDMPIACNINSVSYTHLDVYKRQIQSTH